MRKSKKNTKKQTKELVGAGLASCARYATYTIEGDVWSYGIVLSEVCSLGDMPYTQYVYFAYFPFFCLFLSFRAAHSALQSAAGPLADRCSPRGHLQAHVLKREALRGEAGA